MATATPSPAEILATVPTETPTAAVAPPSISTTLAVDPPSFLLGEGVKLIITATSHASSDITIFTWPMMFNMNLALRRTNFTCVDLDTGEPLRLEMTKGPQRMPFTRTRGLWDDEYIHTFKPEKPVVFSYALFFASERPIPGHRYRLGVQSGEKAEWWWYGSRSTVLAPPWQLAPMEDADGAPIALANIEPVEFTVLSSDSGSPRSRKALGIWSSVSSYVAAKYRASYRFLYFALCRFLWSMGWVLRKVSGGWLCGHGDDDSDDDQ